MHAILRPRKQRKTGSRWRPTCSPCGACAGWLALAILACAKEGAEGNSLADAEGSSPTTDLKRVPAPADLPRDRALQVAFLVVDGVYNTELTAPYDIFQHTIFHAPPGMKVFTVSPDGEMVTTFEGLRLEPHHSFETAPKIDILVVPSAEHSMDSDLDLRRGVSFVHDGKAITSWGGARSFDPAMYLADHLYGEAATQGIGRGMVISWPPAPGVMPAVIIEP